MMPEMPGERVFLADLKPGDQVDVWSRRSGGYFYQPNRMVLHTWEDGTVRVSGGVDLKVDAGWAELRRTCSG